MEKTSKKGFVLYYDYAACLAMLNMEERGALLTALLEANPDSPDSPDYPDRQSASVALTPAAEMAYRFITAQISRDSQKYALRAEASRENGKKGGRPRKDVAQNQEPSPIPTDISQNQSFSEKPDGFSKTLTDTDTVTDTDTDIDTDTEIISLSRPTRARSTRARSTRARSGDADASAASPVSDGAPLKQRSSSAQFEQEFESLWALYPRKEGKKKALAAYERARRRGVSFEEVESGVQRYAEIGGQREMRYIKNGATWFTGECWNDEVKEDGYRHDDDSAVDDFFAKACAGITL